MGSLFVKIIVWGFQKKDGRSATGLYLKTVSVCLMSLNRWFFELEDENRIDRPINLGETDKNIKIPSTREEYLMHWIQE